MVSRHGMEYPFLGRCFRINSSLPFSRNRLLGQRMWKAMNWMTFKSSVACPQSAWRAEIYSNCTSLQRWQSHGDLPSLPMKSKAVGDSPSSGFSTGNQTAIPWFLLALWYYHVHFSTGRLCFIALIIRFESTTLLGVKHRILTQSADNSPPKSD